VRKPFLVCWKRNTPLVYKIWVRVFLSLLYILVWVEEFIYSTLKSHWQPQCIVRPKLLGGHFNGGIIDVSVFNPWYITTILCLYLLIFTFYTQLNQVVAILMKTGLNNVVRPTLFTVVVNNIQQHCYTWLLTSVYNVGRTTLFNPVKQRAHNFYACTKIAPKKCLLNRHLVLFVTSEGKM
jgi:hypothetical protein